MPKKTTLPFFVVCQKLSHSLPEHGALPGDSDSRLNRPILAKEVHPGTKLENKPFLGRLHKKP